MNRKRLAMLGLTVAMTLGNTGIVMAAQTSSNDSQQTQITNTSELPELPPEGIGGERPELPPEGIGGERPELPPEGLDGERPELPEGVTEGERPELPEGIGGERPELPEGTEGELPELPEGTEGERPELPPEGIGGERPELPEGTEGERPELPEGTEGERPELPEGTEGEMPEMGQGEGTFNFKDGRARFMGPMDESDSVIVPSTTTGEDGESLPVTEIAAGAFKDDKNIENVELGENIEQVGKNAFKGATNLTDLKIDGSVEEGMFAKNSLRNAGGKAGRNLTITVNSEDDKNAMEKMLRKAGALRAKVVVDDNEETAEETAETTEETTEISGETAA